MYSTEFMAYLASYHKEDKKASLRHKIRHNPFVFLLNLLGLAN